MAGATAYKRAGRIAAGTAVAVFAVAAGLYVWGERLAGPAVRYSDAPLQTVDAASVASDWPAYGGQADASKYSSLAQINTGNVGQLEVAWRFHTGDSRPRTANDHATTNESTPILVNDKLIFCTPLSSVIAVEPHSGKQIWRANFRKSPKDTVNPVYNCRGVAAWQATDTREAAGFCGSRILVGTDTGVLFALDAATGKRCTDFGDNGQIDLNRLDYHGIGRIGMTSPPAVVGDVVVAGNAIRDDTYQNAPDGIVRGFDVRSGAELWSWNPIPPELSARSGAANAWGPLSVDVERGWVFLPTSTPSVDIYGVDRQSNIPDANAVVALDGRTGQKIWSFQTVHHAIWDYDVSAAPVLLRVRHNGQVRPAVLQATKTGFLFLLDRESGEPLFPVEERPVPKSDIPGESAWPTQPFPTLPKPLIGQRLDAKNVWGAALFDRMACRAMLGKLRNEGMFTPPSRQGSLVYPGYLSGTKWDGVAYDQQHGIAVMASVDMPFVEALVPRSEFDASRDAPGDTRVYDLQGAPYIMTRRPLLSPLGAPCNPPPWGKLSAVDLTTGELRWQIPFGRQPMFAGLYSPARWGGYVTGGPIITAGGLIFIGATLDSRFHAYDLASGRLLWSAPVPAPAVATPMTYESHGRQFVVVSAGGHASLDTVQSDDLIAYALPRRNH